MNLTIHCNHELSDEAKMLIERMAQAKLDEDIDLRGECEASLFLLGWMVSMMDTDFKASKVDVYISKY